MAWVKIDDKWANHPKLVTVGPLGKSLFMDGLCYSAQYLTDGFIPSAAADFLCLPFNEFQELPVLDGDIYKPIEWLVNQNLWEKVDGGYKIHDYLEYNPSRAQTIAERDAAKERMKRSREQKDSSEDVRQKFNRSSDSPVPVPVPHPVVLPTSELGNSEANASGKKTAKKPLPENGDAQQIVAAYCQAAGIEAPAVYSKAVGQAAQMVKAGITAADIPSLYAFAAEWKGTADLGLMLSSIDRWRAKPRASPNGNPNPYLNGWKPGSGPAPRKAEDWQLIHDGRKPTWGSANGGLDAI